MIRPALGPNSQEANVPQPASYSISRRLSRLSLPGDLHPDPGTPGSQVATVLGRISFKKTLRKSTVEIEVSLIGCGTVPSLSNNSGIQ